VAAGILLDPVGLLFALLYRKPPERQVEEEILCSRLD
jgi:hypothetical protein